MHKELANEWVELVNILKERKEHGNKKAAKEYEATEKRQAEENKRLYRELNSM